MSWLVKVHKRGQVQWEYRWQERGKTRSKKIPGAATRTHAKKAQALWDIQRSEPRNNVQPWTLEETYEKVKTSQDYSPNYLKNLKTYWINKDQGILNYFGKSRMIRTIKLPDLLDWIPILKAEEGLNGNLVKNTTILHYVHALSRAMDLAVSYGVLRENPCRHPEIKKALPDDTGKRDRFVKPGEIKLLLEVAKSNVQKFFILAWSTAGRMSEVLSLEEKDLLEDDGLVRFEHDPRRGKRTKSKKTDYVRVEPGIIAYIKSIHKPVEGSDWLFVHRKGKRKGQRIMSLKKGILSAVSDAGLEGITSHLVRHGASSFLGGQGIGLTVIRDHLRHGDLRTLDRYSHGDNSEKRRASKVLAEAILDMKPCPDSCPDARIEEAKRRLKRDPEFVSAVKTVRKKMRQMERETGLEPATLSLGS